jgi:hypothetical protein
VLPDWRDYVTTPGGADALDRVEIDAGAVMRALRRRKGAGATGVRNEHLRALTREFEHNGEAARGATRYIELAALLANAELPPWFYALLGINRLVMPYKKTPEPGEVPDCRPVGVPQADRCCIERAVALSAEAAHVAYFLPEQLGVGVKNGIGVLVHGMRGLVEENPGFVLGSFDVRNAHQCFSRDACLRAYGRIPGLSMYVPYMHANLAPEALVRAGSGFLNNRSSHVAAARVAPRARRCRRHSTA